MDRSYWPARIIDSIYIVTYKYHQLACRASKNHDANNDCLTSFSSLSSSSLSALFRRPWNQDLIDLFFTYTCLSSLHPLTITARTHFTSPSSPARSTSLPFNETKQNAARMRAKLRWFDSCRNSRWQALFIRTRARTPTKRNGFLPPVEISRRDRSRIRFRLAESYTFVYMRATMWSEFLTFVWMNVESFRKLWTRLKRKTRYRE